MHFSNSLTGNVAQTNNFFKNVWHPATKGDLTPLLMTTFGASLAGYVIKELRQKVEGKASPVPSLSDIANPSRRGRSGNILLR